jgi:PIN domain nuclease of toxin-antitoxin system
MKFLLDTHIFLCFISGETRLPADWRDIIRDAGNDVYLSVVSLWEAIIKYHLNKLPLPESAETYLPTQRARHQIASLSLDETSVRRLADLPPVHRDPCDRMLVCQALEHNLTIVTVDGAFKAYPAPILGRS